MRCWYHPHDPDRPNEESIDKDEEFDSSEDDIEDPAYMPLTEFEEHYNNAR